MGKQAAQTKAFTYLRNQYYNEYRNLYKEAVKEEPLPKNSTQAERHRRNARAQCRAQMLLKARYPESYQRFRSKAIQEGFSPSYRA